MKAPEGVTNEIAEVHICYGKGIVMVVNLLVRIGLSEERIKEEAIKHFKEHMPTREEIGSLEQMILKDEATIEVKHEFDAETP